MSSSQDRQAVEHLEQVNAELTESLARCRELLSECRSKLVANANEPPGGEASEEALEA